MKFALLMFLISAMAEAHPRDGGGPGGHGPGAGGMWRAFMFPGVLDGQNEPADGPCAGLSLTMQQKTVLKDAFLKFKNDQIDLESQVKKAHLKYETVMMNKESEAKDAKEALEAIRAATGEMFKAHDEYRVKMFYETLKPEQRAKGYACEKSMMMPIFGHPGPDGKGRDR